MQRFLLGLSSIRFGWFFGQFLHRTGHISLTWMSNWLTEETSKNWAWNRTKEISWFWFCSVGFTFSHQTSNNKKRKNHIQQCRNWEKKKEKRKNMENMREADRKMKGNDVCLLWREKEGGVEVSRGERKRRQSQSETERRMRGGEVWKSKSMVEILGEVEERRG